MSLELEEGDINLARQRWGPAVPPTDTITISITSSGETYHGHDRSLSQPLHATKRKQQGTVLSGRCVQSLVMPCCISEIPRVQGGYYIVPCFVYVKDSEPSIADSSPKTQVEAHLALAFNRTAPLSVVSFQGLTVYIIAPG
jgi:hypothetical protein